MFRIAGHKGNKNKFVLYDETMPKADEAPSKTVKNTAEELPEERIGAALNEHIASIKQQKSVKLIDGELLAELLVRYEVGVLPAQNIKIYKIDTDYFNS